MPEPTPPSPDPMIATPSADLRIDLNTDGRLAPDALQASPELDERAMDLATLGGVLAAVVIGPDVVRPSQWIS